jgi:hypothetical protein
VIEAIQDGWPFVDCLALRWRHYDLSDVTSRHDVSSQKTWIFNSIAVRTSDHETLIQPTCFCVDKKIYCRIYDFHGGDYDVTPCSMVEICQHCRRMYCLHLQGPTRRHIVEDNRLYYMSTVLNCGFHVSFFLGLGDRAFHFILWHFIYASYWNFSLGFSLPKMLE